MAFGEWAYSYFFCYKHVYKDWNDKPSMIALLVVTNFFWLIALIAWASVYIRGAGKMPINIPPYDLERFVCNGEKASVISSIDNKDIESTYSTNTNNDLLRPPPIFECDLNGLPFWCSECTSLKVLRCHHSSYDNKCVPLFDHYCTFMGCTIGKHNYFLFLLFVYSIEFVLMFTWITVVIYCGIKSQMHSALIVFVVHTGILSIMVFNVVYNSINDLLNGDTTVERLNRQRWRKFDRKNKNSLCDPIYNCYVNVQHPSRAGLRVVVELNPKDKPFNNGFSNNFKLWFYKLDKLKTPQDFADFQYTLFSEKFKNDIKLRIENGEYIIFGSLKNLQ